VSAALRSDPVQVRLQVLLAALRPDCAAPMVPTRCLHQEALRG
jgi:hypothetical protein